jgi:hypothetical protein
MEDGEAEDVCPGPAAHSIDDMLREPAVHQRLGDITFEVTGDGFEIWFSDRIAQEHYDLVDESADWLENEMGALNLGQIDYKVVMADGVLTDEIRNGLINWWSERVDELVFNG